MLEANINKKLQINAIIISLLILLSLILFGWKVIYYATWMIIEYWNQIPFYLKLYTITVALLFIILNIYSVYGLFKIKERAIWLTYITIIFSTFVARYSYLPLKKFIQYSFLTDPTLHWHNFFLFLPNALLFAYLVYFHLQYFKYYYKPLI